MVNILRCKNSKIKTVITIPAKINNSCKQQVCLVNYTKQVSFKCYEVFSFGSRKASLVTWLRWIFGWELVRAFSTSCV